MLRVALFFKVSQNPCTGILSRSESQFKPSFVEIGWKMCPQGLATHLVFTPMKQNHENPEYPIFEFGGQKFKLFTIHMVKVCE